MTGRKRFAFRPGNFITAYISDLLLILTCSISRKRPRQTQNDNHDNAMLNQIRKKFDLHTDALKIMKTLRNHASIIKSLLTKRQRILSKFNSNRVLEALTQSDDFVDSASDAVD